MKEQDFYLSVGYLASPKRQTNIEVEMPLKRQQRFISQYADWTDNHPLPQLTNTAPYYVWKEGTNKYGLESRAYFISTDNMPGCLEKLLEPRKTQNRPGYENWERRISKNDYIIQLLKAGFILGPNQKYERICALVPAKLLDDFNTGFAL